MKIDETVKHYMLNLEVRRYSVHTRLGYNQSLLFLVDLLKQLHNVVDLESVTILHLRSCVQHLMTVPPGPKSKRPLVNGLTLSVSSVCTYMRRWKAFFTWCHKEELIEKNPATRLEYPKMDDRLIPSFSEGQIQDMLNVFDLSTPGGFRNYTILLLMLDTGIRRSEVSSLRVDDVYDTYISVFGKGRKERQIGVHPEISNLLWKYIHKYRHPANPDEPALFLALGNGYVGKPFGRGGMNALMHHLKVETGIDDVRLSSHTFRHTFACMYLDGGGDLFSLSREMGHTNVKTTEKYLKSFTSKNARAHHNEHSPVNRIQLRSHTKKKGKGKQNKK